jgi:S-adenosyl methyltransferase
VVDQAAEGWAAPTGVDASMPNFARVYDYLLGGKDNFPVDRATAEQALAVAPELRVMARENRAFLQRAVRFLVAEAGICQLLDIGTGLPTQGSVHEVAQQVAPDARVVYVDADPVVIAHSRAMLASSDKAAIIQADLRRPEELLDHPELRALIDLGEPVAVLLVAILHGVTDAEDPVGVVTRLRDAMAPGSYYPGKQIV